MKRHPKPRVVIVATVFPTTLQPYVIDHVVHLLALGWDVHVVCDVFDAPSWAQRADLTAHPTWRQRVHLSGRRGIGAVITSLAPQLVHVAFGYLAPDLLALHDRCRWPMLVSFESLDPRLISAPQVYAPVWAQAAGIHSLSEAVWQALQCAGCPADKPHAIIPPGVDTTVFDPGPQTHTERISAARPLRLLSIGRLAWQKGYEYGLQAIRHLVDTGLACEYRIIGDGDHRPAVEYAVADFGLRDVVSLLGSCWPVAVQAELHWADVLLHASVTETFGIATLEAQAMRVPVVCSDADGLPEAVVHEETGLVVPRRDPAALAAALARLAADPECRQRLGAAGRHRMQAQFQPEALAHRFDALYRQLLAL